MHIQNAAKIYENALTERKICKEVFKKKKPSTKRRDAFYISYSLFYVFFVSLKKKRNFRTKQILGLFMDKKIRFIMIAVWTLDHPSRLIVPLEFSIQLCNTDLCDSNRHHHRRHKNDLSPYCLLRGIATLHRSPSTDLASKGATLNRKCKGYILSNSRP